ncbi:MAG: hypothetical protein PVG07_14525 [Acidobacteriota bacterium]
MTDQDLRRALRSLPRHRASSGFTGRVLKGCDRASPSARSRLGLGPFPWIPTRIPTWIRPSGPITAGAAGALMLLILLVLLIRAASPPALQRPTGVPEQDAVAAAATGPALDDPRTERARLERARLRAELDELKRLAEDLNETWAEETEPVLYVGGDDRFELVLDVQRLAAEQAGRPKPAAYRPN